MTNTVRIAVFGPNLEDQSKGTFHAHAVGCADIARMAKREPVYREPWIVEASTYVGVADDIYADHIAEGSMRSGDGVHDVHFFPCTHGLS